MEAADHSQRLTAIHTRWSVLAQAHQGPDDARTLARRELLLEYHRAVFRYLLGMVRDADLAEELTQDFAVRFLRGDFHGADAERGRFRNFLKTSLRHLVRDHWRKRKRAPVAIEDASLTPAVEDSPDEELDRPFVAAWRAELLARAWEALAGEEQAGAPYYTALRLKASEANPRSAQIAEQLSAQLGRPFTENGVRQLLYRARARFAELLISDVKHSLEGRSHEEVEQELLELDLLNYSRNEPKSAGRG